MERTEGKYDVAIIGGALAGAASALVLLREMPTLRILIVEKSTTFSRRVGEATVELSSYFLMRVLGLTDHLNEHHISKNGLRFWFSNQQTSSIADCSEIGGAYLARIPAYLVDRAVLDEEVLRRATALGAHLLRPAQVKSVELNAGQFQRLVLDRPDAPSTQVEARWVIDASGVAAFLARQNKWWRTNSEHPTTAVWSRWKNVKNFEDLSLAQKFPKWAMSCYGVRGTATNHLMGDGWWAWWIALKGGDVSIGVTFDQRLVNFPDDGTMGERLKTFLTQHPVARELMANAVWTEGDVHWRKNLPYYSTTFAGDGFAIVGDAAGFLDPFYSPGLDWISFTVMRTKELILAERRGESIAEKIAQHNRDFSRSYARWFESIYKDKYQYLGDYDLVKPAFLLDLGFYYLGVAAQPFKRGVAAFGEPLFSTTPSVPFYHFMRFYNRRLAAMAQSRRRRGKLGRSNARQRFMFGGYTFSPASLVPIIRAIGQFLFLEVSEGWRSWLAPSPVTLSVPTIRPATPIEPQQNPARSA